VWSNSTTLYCVRELLLQNTAEIRSVQAPLYLTWLRACVREIKVLVFCIVISSPHQTLFVNQRVSNFSMEISRSRPWLHHSGKYPKKTYVWVNGTNQTKHGYRGRNSTARKHRGLGGCPEKERLGNLYARYSHQKTHVYGTSS